MRRSLPDARIPLMPALKIALLLLLTAACLIGWIGAAAALALGIAFALIFGNPVPQLSRWGSQLLKATVVLLGFTLPLAELWATSVDSFWLTAGVIATTMTAGLLLGKLLGIERPLATLIASGTAICGGSAIAAVAPTIRAPQQAIVVSLAIVFLLNAVALLIFPPVGHYFGLTQTQFGIWAALGIHDTSSVVGAATAYGEDAMQIATTAKLARALWIIPLVLVLSFSRGEEKFKFSVPPFILLFLVASLAGTFIQPIAELAPLLITIAKTGFVIALLWLGASLHREVLRKLPLKPLLQGIILWLLVSTTTLLLVMTFY